MEEKNSFTFSLKVEHCRNYRSKIHILLPATGNYEITGGNLKPSYDDCYCL